jgi:hypothetical protein
MVVYQIGACSFVFSGLDKRVTSTAFHTHTLENLSEILHKNYYIETIQVVSTSEHSA